MTTQHEREARARVQEVLDQSANHESGFGLFSLADVALVMAGSGTQAGASGVSEAGLLTCPNPWCASHRADDLEIYEAHKPIATGCAPSEKPWRVQCPVCPINGPRCSTKAGAIAAWNTRAALSEQSASTPASEGQAFCNKCGFYGAPTAEGFHNRPKDGEQCSYFARPAQPATGMDEGRFSIDGREDDMLIAERHWRWGWRCIARRPKLMTNAEWRPDAERIIAALSADVTQRDGMEEAAGLADLASVGSAAKAVESFRSILFAFDDPVGWPSEIGELRGKNLACWCALNQPCHADILLELANASAQDETTNSEGGATDGYV